MSSVLRLSLVTLFVFGCLHSLSARDRDDSLVRETEALTSEQERAALHVPDGFEVQLFADETQLGGKPINMAFDARGRLWVSSTREYPYAMKKEKWSPDTTRAIGSKDTIRILEDTDGDGRADKVTIFADDMNIPTGVLPYKHGCIAWSIPNILYLEDTDGDGKADKRTILFGPLGWEKDTHGMISSLRMGLDGWVYATHGFSNTSHFQAKDGSVLDITSGSVFRFKPDGSRVERWTNGQVNPFGLCWDSWGNLYSADCHSSPVYQLIRGASYPSFGKPHDGLGFAPIMCSHSHGSTGISGVVYIDGGIWGPEWDDHLFLGNPVTSKVNHDLVTFTGSTPKANEKPDLITSDDPWFRPVDLQLGPDSALYVADFYNKIIGHYEVPLDHPARDRDRGRIWRVVRKGFTNTLGSVKELLESSDDALREDYDKKLAQNPNLTLRRLWIQELDRRHLFPSSLGSLVNPGLHATATSYIVKKWGDRAMPIITRTGLDHGDFADPTLAISRGDAKSAKTLLFREFLQSNPQDVSLRHTLLIAIRNFLLPSGRFNILAEEDTAALREELIRISCAIPTSDAANWLFEQIKASTSTTLEQSLRAMAINHIAHYLPAVRQGELVELVQKHFGNDLDTQLDLFAAIREGSSTLRSRATDEWAAQLMDRLLTALTKKETSDWHAVTKPTDTIPSPWVRQKRKGTDGLERDSLSSLPPGGEKLTGTMRSKAFDVPAKLSFWIAGHSGNPSGPLNEKNFIRLVDADTEQEIMKSFPPRNDTAQLVTWDLSQTKAKHACIELTDGDTGSAYAWFAVGGFAPEVVGIPSPKDVGDKRIRALAELCNTALKAVGRPGLQPGRGAEGNGKDSRSTDRLQACLTFLAALPNKDRYAADTRFALAETLAARHKDTLAALLTPLVREVTFATPVLEALAGPDDKGVHAALAAIFKSSPHRQQVKLAESLCVSRDGARSLISLAPPRVLADPVVAGKVKALGDDALVAQIKELTAKLPPQNTAVNALIATRLKGYNQDKADEKRGEALFTATCAVCHRIGVRGNLVGPQLDGIGARGAERLLEDILDPNRAVDPAFRLHFVKQKDGAVLGGILRREEGDALIFADAAAQEHTVKKADIIEDQVSEFSLMPAGLGEALTEEQVHDLLRYLLGKTAG